MTAAGSTDAVVREHISPLSGQYLEVEAPDVAQQALVRTIGNRGRPDAEIVDVPIVDGARKGICTDLKVRFSPCEERPDLSPDDKLVVWLKAGDGASPAALYVTAGAYEGDFRSVVSRDYRVTAPAGVDLADGGFHRLTMWSVADITSGGKVLAYALYLDGRRLVAEADGYQVMDGFDGRSLMTGEARMLYATRRLFPAMSKGGTDAAQVMRGLAFSGIGDFDDIAFTAAAPDFASGESVFTLRWDAGVASLTVAYSDAAGTNAVRNLTAEELAQHRLDLPVATVPASLAASELTVTVTYRGDSGFTAASGVWRGDVDCAVAMQSDTVGKFTYTSAALNPVGYVSTGRDAVSVGAGAFSTFAEAMRNRPAGSRLITLAEDVTIACAEPGAEFDDNGYFALGPGDEVVLDLCGHVLKGSNAAYATIENRGGELRIIDSIGGGRVVPYADDYFAEFDEDFAFQRVAVHNSGSQRGAAPKLAIEGGVFDGDIVNDARPTNTLGTVTIGGSCRFISDNADEFPYADCVTNAATYFAYAEPYWSEAASGAFIWCGAGDDDDWGNPDNWRCGTVPGVDDLAVFPATTVPWVADMGEGVVVTNIWFDGDTELHGRNDFTPVVWEHAGQHGRISGDATIVFRGRIPQDLSGLLATNWAGTVRIESVAGPVALRALASWGTGSSSVVFNGVRGYLSDRLNVTAPYTLVLEDDGATPAWYNEAGFTGSIISFAALAGDGSLVFPANSVPILQVFQFRDASGFTGRMSIAGKRVLIGSGTVGSAAAGSLTCADGCRLRSGLDWSVTTAAFGSGFEVLGSTADTLLAYTGAEPDVSRSIVFVENRVTGAVSTNDLVLVGGNAVGFGPSTAVTIDGVLVRAQALAATAKSGASIRVADPTAVSIVGRSVRIGQSEVGAFADYYDVGARADGSFRLSLNEFAVPFIGSTGESSSMTFENGMVWVAVHNARLGLWYGLQHKTSLNEEWAEPETWQIATVDGGSLLLYAPAADPSGFYRVVVTDRDPDAEEAE